MTWPPWLCRLLPCLGRRQADADVEEELRLLRPLPYPEPERIVSVRGLTNVTYPALRDDTQTFEHLAAYSAPRRFTWRGPSGTHALRGWEVSPSFFGGVYGVAPHPGRVFTDEEAVAGAHRVVVLSFHAWRDRFGSDPEVIGRPLDLEGAPYTVVGVLPRGFSAASRGMEAWTPLVVPPYELTNLTDMHMTTRMSTPMFALGRVLPGSRCARRRSSRA